MNELQDLGKELTALSKEQLMRMNLEEDLRDAVLEWQRIPRFEAKRRQLQYIGRLMRSLDPEPIRAALAVVRGESAGEIARLHRLENLRQRLLDNEADALAEIATIWPAADITHLRQLRRAAVKEIAEARPPRHFRALFQLLKTLDEAQPAP